MADKPSHAKDREETKAAKALERASLAEQVWSEVEVQRAVVEERTARLKAQRLARDAQDEATAKLSKATPAKG